MSGIDENLEFHPLGAAVLTISDTRTADNDTSGAYLADGLANAGHKVIRHEIVPDQVRSIAEAVQSFVQDPKIDVILTTGGTGFAVRDVTPEAVRPLLTREMDGFSTVFHMVSHGTVGLSTLQSRALAGQIGDKFIFCLPGSTGACRDGWDNILKFELDSRYRPCSLAGQVPRLRHVCA